MEILLLEKDVRLSLRWESRELMVIAENNMFFLWKYSLCPSFCLDVPPRLIWNEDNLDSEPHSVTHWLCDMEPQFLHLKTTAVLSPSGGCVKEVMSIWP